MIGILPAAGKAERIHGLPKYLLPMADSYLVRIHITRIMDTGCRHVLIGTSENSRRLADEYCYGNLGNLVGVKATTYLAKEYETMSQTILSGYKQMLSSHDLRQENILFGMPDTYWQADYVYDRLADTIKLGAGVAVALFKARPGQHTSVGMIETQGGRILSVVDKPQETDLAWLWGALAWRPEFWQYIKPQDAHVGFALADAIEAGMDVRAVYCEGNYWDCGSNESYFECIRSMT